MNDIKKSDKMKDYHLNNLGQLLYSAFIKIILVIIAFSLINVLIENFIKFPSLEIDENINEIETTINYLNQAPAKNAAKSISSNENTEPWDSLIDNIPDNINVNEVIIIGYITSRSTGQSHEEIIEDIAKSIDLLNKLRTTVNIIYKSIPFIFGLSIILAAIIMKLAGNIIFSQDNIDKSFLSFINSKLFYANILFNVIYYTTPKIMLYKHIDYLNYALIPIGLSVIFLVFIIFILAKLPKFISTIESQYNDEIKNKSISATKIIFTYLFSNILVLLCFLLIFYPYAKGCMETLFGFYWID